MGAKAAIDADEYLEEEARSTSVEAEAAADD
jgi:hypothetical protein